MPPRERRRRCTAHAAITHCVKAYAAGLAALSWGAVPRPAGVQAGVI
jgi:hypothetical protein